MFLLYFQDLLSGNGVDHVAVPDDAEVVLVDDVDQRSVRADIAVHSVLRDEPLSRAVIPDQGKSGGLQGTPSPG